MEHYIAAFKNYAKFKGRTSRQEYWKFILFHIIVNVILFFMDAVIYIALDINYNPDTVFGILGSLYFLFALLPTFTVTIRRLHDTNRSGWFLLVLLLPLFGPIWLLYLMCKESDHFINSYGPDPTLVVLQSSS